MQKSTLTNYKTEWKIIGCISIFLWAVLIVSGFTWLTDYAPRSSQLAHPVFYVSLDNFRARPKNLPTLLLFVHPQCPCTRATMAEMAQLMVQNRGRVAVQIFVYNPLNSSEKSLDSQMWKLAQMIPDVTVSTISNLELLRFGISTSGQTLLYDARGKLMFSGGITSARGHEGDNAGRAAINAYLHGDQMPTDHTPVFGCSITDAEDTAFDF